MRVFRRPGWSLLLACCLLLQAVWSTAAMACAPRHTASAAHPSALPACHEAALVDGAGAAAAAQSPDETPAAGVCSACAACLLGSALPVRVSLPPAPPGEPVAAPPAAALTLSFLADGPERPPRQQPPTR